MAFSSLSHLFNVERERQRINRSVTAAGFAVPLLGEIQIADENETVFLSTNMRGTFLPTRKSKAGTARYGLTECSTEEESALVTELSRVLWDQSIAQGWPLRCTSVPEAAESFRQQGLEPRTLVVSAELAENILGHKTPEGLAGVVDRMQVLVTGLPATTAMVALAPASTGYCTRVGDVVGLLVRPYAFRVVRT